MKRLFFNYGLLSRLFLAISLVFILALTIFYLVMQPRGEDLGLMALLT